MPAKGTTHNKARERYLLIPGFSFEVTFNPPFGNNLDTRFQEVSGLSAEIPVEEVVEGGVKPFRAQTAEKCQVSEPYPEKRDDGQCVGVD